MDWVNRVLVLTLALIAATVATCALLVGAGLWSAPPGAATVVLGWLGGEGTLAQLGSMLVAGVVLVVSVAVATLELVPRRSPDHLVERAEDGDVVLNRRTLRDFIVHIGLQIPDVRAMSVRVRESSDGLLVQCRVDANARAVLVELGSAVRQEVRTRVREQLGLEVARVDTIVRMSTTRAQRPVLK